MSVRFVILSPSNSSPTDRPNGPCRRRTVRPLTVAVILGTVAFLLCASVGAGSGPTTPPGKDSSSTPTHLASDSVAAPSTTSSLLAHRLAAVSLGSHPSGYLPGPPAWLAYDHGDHSFYVAVPPSSVDIVPGNFTWTPVVNATIPVGSDPFGVAYDNATGDVFVTNTGSDNVSVLSGQQADPIATITVGSSPLGIAYDPVNHQVYVANNGSDNVSILSGPNLTLLATVPVGSEPTGIAADPATGNVFVANYGSDNVSVISGSTNHVLVNDPVERGPYGVAVDNASDTIYVTDEEDANVSVLSGSSGTGITNISIGTQYGYALALEGIAYDSADGLLWIGGGANPLVALSPSNQSVVAVLTFDPSGVAFDPDTGNVCVTNTANTTFECALFLSTPTSPVQLNFSETGLPSGFEWQVTLGNDQYVEDGEAVYAVQNSIIFQVPPNETLQFSVWCLQGGLWFATPASGNVTVYSNAVGENLSFTQASLVYPITLQESGLPTVSQWSFTLGGYVWSSSSGTYTVEVPNGTYRYFAQSDRAGYTPASPSGWVKVNGTGARAVIQFSGPPWYVATFNESGLPNGTNWSVEVNGTYQNAQAPVIRILFGEPNGTYTYSVYGNGTYEASEPSGAVVVAGANVTVTIGFSLIPTFSVTFLETGLPSGTWWSMNLTDHYNRTTSSSIVFTVQNGSDWWVVRPSLVGTVDYLPSPDYGTVTVNGSPLEFNISFAPEASTFNVTFDEAGLPPATTWGVVVNNSTLQTSTTSITTSLENGSYLFAVEYLSGFQSSPSSGSVNVAGAAVTVDLAFTSGGDYPVDLAQSGLPNGTLWSATLGGVTLYSNSSLLAFTEPNGTYPFTVATTANYSANFTSPVVVNGSSVRIGVTFSNTTYLVTFLEMGLPLGALWTVTATNEATRAVTSGQSTATSVALRLAVGTYLLSAAGPPGYRVSLSSSALSVHGAGTLAPTASFAPAGVVGAPPVVMIGLITTVGLLIAVVAALGAAFGYTRYRSGQWRAEGERWVEAIRKEQSSEYDDDQPGQR